MIADGNGNVNDLMGMTAWEWEGLGTVEVISARL